MPWRHISTLSLTSSLDVGEWSTPCRGLFVPGKRQPLPNSHKVEWTSGSIRRGTEHYLPLAGVRTPSRPARSKSGEEEEWQKLIVWIGAPWHSDTLQWQQCQTPCCNPSQYQCGRAWQCRGSFSQSVSASSQFSRATEHRTWRLN